MSIQPKVIDIIRRRIARIVSKGYMPTTLMVTKDIERQMFLDESFPKGDNYEHVITVDKYELHFNVVDGDNWIKVLTDLQPIQ